MNKYHQFQEEVINVDKQFLVIKVFIDFKVIFKI